MAGSDAEERIRAKAERRLRRAYPQARIIHELNLAGMGSTRIDLAAIETDRIILAEIKSERDTLTRLAKQVDSSMLITGHVFVYAAEKWRAPLGRPAGGPMTRPGRVVELGRIPAGLLQGCSIPTEVEARFAYFRSELLGRFGPHLQAGCELITRDDPGAQCVIIEMFVPNGLEASVAAALTVDL